LDSKVAFLEQFAKFMEITLKTVCSYGNPRIQNFWLEGPTWHLVKH